MFATIGKAQEDDLLAGIDESKMERALDSLMKESEGINEEDPRQMASLMRKFSDRTGVNLGENMEEAIARMEKGEDPDQIEKEMGDLLGEDEDFSFDTIKKRAMAGKPKPIHDEKLYEL